MSSPCRCAEAIIVRPIAPALCRSVLQSRSLADDDARRARRDGADKLCTITAAELLLSTADEPGPAAGCWSTAFTVRTPRLIHRASAILTSRTWVASLFACLVRSDSRSTDGGVPYRDVIGRPFRCCRASSQCMDRSGRGAASSHVQRLAFSFRSCVSNVRRK
jgi:hypothetical protein